MCLFLCSCTTVKEQGKAVFPFWWKTQYSGFLTPLFMSACQSSYSTQTLIFHLLPLSLPASLSLSDLLFPLSSGHLLDRHRHLLVHCTLTGFRWAFLRSPNTAVCRAIKQLGAIMKYYSLEINHMK